jgi:anhydro-N-acetylmuramic acid kinase
MQYLISLLRKKERFAIGVLSGTSVDGIDVGYVRLTGAGEGTKLELLGFHTYPLAPALRRKILENFSPESARLPMLSSMNFLIGEMFADAILAFQKEFKVKYLDFVASHGQTFWHQPQPLRIGRYKIRSTLQLGESAVIANRVGVPVVSDFRVADIALGGEGAPLAPYLDWLLFRHRTRSRVLINIGGISNLTALKANAKLSEVVYFDCGPGNVMIDMAAQLFFHQPFDKNGALAAQGTPSQAMLRTWLREPYYRREPPKSTGRELFSADYFKRLIDQCRKLNLSAHDILATLTALTAESIAMQLRTFVLSRFQVDEVFVAGGGAENLTLMRDLRSLLEKLSVHKVSKQSELETCAIPAKAKEAVLFATLGHEFLSGRSASLATPAILGKLSLPAEQHLRPRYSS